MAHYAGNYEEGYVPFSFNQPVVDDGGTGPLPESTTPATPSQPTDALSYLWELAQKDPSYMEAYLQALAERENTTNAQAWYEKMSGSQYQRAVKDLQAAGLNPYLALTNLSGAGSGSVSPAGTWSSSPYANQVARKNAESQNMTARSNTIKAIATMTTSIVAMMALLL